MTVRELIKKVIVSDSILLLGLVVGLIGLSFVVQLSYPNSANTIRQGTIAGIATLIAVISYRYSIRSNIRSAINQLEPVEFGDRKIVPSLYNVKWRPAWMSHIPFDFFQRITTVMVYAHDISTGESRPVDGKKLFLDEWGIVEEVNEDPEDSKVEFVTPPDDLLAEMDSAVRTGIDYRLAVSVEGLLIICETCNGRDVQKTTDHILRMVSIEYRD